MKYKIVSKESGGNISLSPLSFYKSINYSLLKIRVMNEKLTFEQKVYAFAKEFRPSDKEIEEFKQFLNNDTQKEFIFKGRGVALIIKDKNDSLSVLRGNAYIDPLLL